MEKAPLLFLLVNLEVSVKLIFPIEEEPLENFFVVFLGITFSFISLPATFNLIPAKKVGKILRSSLLLDLLLNS